MQNCELKFSIDYKVTNNSIRKTMVKNSPNTSHYNELHSMRCLSWDWKMTRHRIQAIHAKTTSAGCIYIYQNGMCKEICSPFVFVRSFVYAQKVLNTISAIVCCLIIYMVVILALVLCGFWFYVFVSPFQPFKNHGWNWWIEWRCTLCAVYT